MRILLLNDAEPYCLGASYLRAFRQMGQDAALHDPAAELARWRLWRSRPFRRVFERPLLALYSRRLLQRLLAVPADLVWVGKGAWAMPWVWRKFKELRPAVKLICCNSDNPIIAYSRGGNRPWVTASIPLFDLYVTYNRQLIGPLQQAGARRVLRLPFAWDPELHPAIEPEPADRARYGCDVIFVGNGDACRERWLVGIVQAAQGLKWNVAIYGSWRTARSQAVQAVVRGGALYGVEMVKATRCAKVSLNILREQNDGSHNMRTFEVPGCGGFLVSQRSPEQQEFFPEAEAAVYFSDAREAVEKISALLGAESRRRQLRECAWAIVQQHTYVDRAWELLEVVRSM